MILHGVSLKLQPMLALLHILVLKVTNFHRETPQMLCSEQNVQVCDATKLIVVMQLG